MKFSLFSLLAFYLICITVSGQTNSSTKQIIEFKKIKDGKITSCESGDEIRFVTVFSDTILKAKIKNIRKDSILILEVKHKTKHKHTIEVRQYRLNEIKSIEKETVIYKTAAICSKLCFVTGSCFFITGNGDFDNYVFGAECYATGILIAIPAIVLHRKYKLNSTHYATIKSVKRKTKRSKK
jgi:hypothetical protein